MKNFHSLLSNTLTNGIDQLNTRTNKTCRTLIGETLVYDLRDGYPAITTKKLAFKLMKTELLGFFRGYDNAEDFRKLGCSIWDANANETQAWLNNPNRKSTDDLGRIYGVQWKNWSDKRVVLLEERNDFESRGYMYLGMIEDLQIKMGGKCILMERKINQLENALTTILTNPSDRRIIVSAWNPGEMDLMCLPSCHMDYRFIPMENTKTLHLVMTQRSCDLFLGIPFNIASTALFLSIMARLSGYTAGTITMQLTNCHIYEDHYTQVEEQLRREHFAQPTLNLSDNIKKVSLDQVKGAFERIEPEDIVLNNYISHPAILAPMAV